MMYRPWVNADNQRFFDRIMVNEPPGEVRFYQPSRRLDTLVVTVIAGALDIWFGAVDLANPPTVPDMRFLLTCHPVFVPLPLGVQSFSYRVSGAVPLGQASILVEGE